MCVKITLLFPHRDFSQMEFDIYNYRIMGITSITPGNSPQPVTIRTISVLTIAFSNFPVLLALFKHQSIYHQMCFFLILNNRYNIHYAKPHKKTLNKRLFARISRVVAGM